MEKRNTNEPTKWEKYAKGKKAFHETAMQPE